MASSNSKLFEWMFQAARWAHRSGFAKLPAYRWLAQRVKNHALDHSKSLPLPYRELEIPPLKLRIPVSSFRSYLFRPHEPETTALLRSILTSGMTFLDVGAHIGYFSALAAIEVGQNGRVIAIEPDPDNQSFLTDNLKRNDLPQVEALTALIGASRGPRNFYQAKTGSISSVFPASGHRKTLKMRQIPLDDMVEDHLDLIKIDVEGAELEVLAGMERILNHNSRLQLIVEWNPRAQKCAGRSPLELPQTLARLGFELGLLDAPQGGPQTVPDALAVCERDYMAPNWYANLHARRAGFEP